MNLNQLAQEVAMIEGKKVPVNIAQIKEILKCLGVVLSDLETSEALALMARLIKRK